MKIIKPREELREFIRYYWVLESNEPFSILTFPIGCPQIIFHRKTPLYIPELDKSQEPFTISGQVNFPSHIQSDGNLEMIVAVFYPHTINLFINTPPSSFYNLEISGYDLENKQLNEIASSIFVSIKQSEWINTLENYPMRILTLSMNNHRTVNYTYPRLNNPDITTNNLGYAILFSKKQFERIFRDYVGMNPKEYARIVRFQRSLWMLQRGDRDFVGIAAECGYSDQSHFIREFKSMTGLTPKALLTYCKPYSDLFTNPI